MEILRIAKSPRRFKKYRANVIINGQLFENVDFGDTRYQQYKDNTPLKLYSHMDHNDIKRRKSYLARHKHDKGPAGILSRKLLW